MPKLQQPRMCSKPFRTIGTCVLRRSQDGLDWNWWIKFQKGVRRKKGDRVPFKSACLFMQAGCALAVEHYRRLSIDLLEPGVNTKKRMKKWARGRKMEAKMVYWDRIHDDWVFYNYETFFQRRS